MAVEGLLAILEGSARFWTRDPDGKTLSGFFDPNNPPTIPVGSEFQLIVLSKNESTQELQATVAAEVSGPSGPVQLSWSYPPDEPVIIPPRQTGSGRWFGFVADAPGDYFMRYRVYAMGDLSDSWPDEDKLPLKICTATAPPQPQPWINQLVNVLAIVVVMVMMGMMFKKFKGGRK